MKRSEMVRIIWEAINELEDANHVLQRMEKAGMLPPPVMRESPLTIGPANIFVNEWEPEDE